MAEDDPAPKRARTGGGPLDLSHIAEAKLMHVIVSNVLKHPDDLSKFGRINLAGAAGARLAAARGC